MFQNIELIGKAAFISDGIEELVLRLCPESEATYLDIHFICFGAR
jgi:hypothetical protein